MGGGLYHEELPRVYVLPCVSCTKIARSDNLTSTRVHPARSGYCFTHVCQGGIFTTYFLDTHLSFPGWAELNLSGPRGQVIRRQSRTDRWRHGGGPQARKNCGGSGTQSSLRLSAGGGRRRGTPSSKRQPAALATAVVTASSYDSSHYSSHGEVSQQQSQQTSLTADINQSISHLEPV